MERKRILAVDDDTEFLPLLEEWLKFRTDTQRMRMEGDQFFLRSGEEMYAALGGYEEALKQSQLIADSVDIQLDLGQRHFPTYKLPPDKTAKDYLYELCIAGLKDRYADVPERWENGELAPSPSSAT